MCWPHGGRKLEGNFDILGRKFKEIMSKLEGNFIFQGGSTDGKVHGVHYCDVTKIMSLDYFNFGCKF